MLGTVVPATSPRRSASAIPATMPPVIITTSSMRAAAVMGAPVMASCTEPTNCSPLSSTVMPAATMSVASTRMPSGSARLDSRIAGVAAIRPPAMCWKKNGRP
ncbi:Uncharacterised protein [Mycobacteroides abscessus subsp. abscessus]|nr:Uncharacterised protein [Mycobacteroides abscessus subsp. abscessus]